ncbi:MAG: hypothetical protein U0163_13960 [Gemmatimonadaceae bacterium]
MRLGRGTSSTPRRAAAAAEGVEEEGEGKRKQGAKSMTTLPKVDLPDGVVPQDGGGGRSRRRATMNTSSPSTEPIVAPRVNYNAGAKSSFKAPQTNTGVNPNAGKGGGKKHGGGRKRH